jgi:Fe-S oxidoreductase
MPAARGGGTDRRAERRRCGLADNFGLEKGHDEVSVACAEEQLLPAVREAAEGTVVLAGGCSCRTQLAGVRGRHRAEVLAEALEDIWPTR